MFEWLIGLFRSDYTVSKELQTIQLAREDEVGPYYITVRDVPIEVITPKKLERIVEASWAGAQEKRVLELDYDTFDNYGRPMK